MDNNDNNDKKDMLEELNEDEEEIIKKREIREKRKKLVLISIGAVIGIFILIGLITFILSAIDNNNKSKTRDREEKILNRTNEYPEPDYDYNIFDDDLYMILDRGVWFNEDGVAKTVMTEKNLKSYPVEAQFMYDVVNLIINGDYEEYNKIFTDDYIKKAGDDLRERFTMQKLFEIEIEYIDYGQLGNQDYWDIQLTYRIKDNDGTFRNDLKFNDDGARPVIYRLVSDNKTGLKVSNVLTKGQYNSGAYN